MIRITAVVLLIIVETSVFRSADRPRPNGLVRNVSRRGTASNEETKWNKRIELMLNHFYSGNLGFPLNLEVLQRPDGLTYTPSYVEIIDARIP